MTIPSRGTLNVDEMSPAQMAWCADHARLRQFGLEALHRGDLGAALAFTDRLCRIQADPSATDWLARAFVHHRGGWQADFAADLDQAIRVGWCESVVLRAVIALHADVQTRVAACHGLISSQTSTHDDVRFALSRLAELGGRVAKRVVRTPSGLGGWLAHRTDSIAKLYVRTGEREPVFVRLGTRQEDDLGAGWRVQPFEIEAEPTEPVELTATLEGGTTIERWTDIPRVLTTSCKVHGEASAFVEADVVVVVPIYADPPTLERCLIGLRTQTPGLRVHHVIVDDCSDDDRVTALGRTFCDDVNGSFIRHPVNAGFSAAINSALARIRSGDVLVLNSDVELPAEAIARLHEAAHRASRIGTVAPLCNDAGSASFPRPFQRNPLLSAVEADAIDVAAARVNAGEIVDVVSNLGSCLYIGDQCRRQVGAFSHGYGRGYYEDVDFCFRAREAGFRNVVAANVYVAHASGRSFGTAKRQLAAENRIVVESRFPNLDEGETTFMRADPLQPLRAAIEEAVVAPSGPTIVIAAAHANRSAALDQRCTDASRTHRVIVLRWMDRGGRAFIELKGRGGQMPQSLRFDLDTSGLERFARYLEPRQVQRIVVFDGDRAPRDLAACLASIAPCRWCVASSSEARFVQPGFSSALRSRAGAATERPPLACDAMSAAYLGLPSARSAEPDSTPLRPRRTAKRLLGILMPEACARSELLVLQVARRMRRDGDIHLAILGTCLDEMQMMSVGNVWVHGAVRRGDEAGLATKLDVAALLSPYDNAHFGLVDEAARQIGCSKAFVDWSCGRLPVQPGDLALPVHMDAVQAADRLIAWCRTVMPEHEHAL